MLPIAATPFYILTNGAQGLQFLHILTNSYFLVLFCLVRFLLLLQ